jgi:transcription antitermination factor NusG
VREKEIDTIKKVLNGDMEVFAEEYFQEGSNVRITYGQFAGLEGVMVKRCNDSRLVIKVDGLTKAFSINLPANFAELVCAPGETTYKKIETS